MAYTLGLDYGTNSVRCLVVDVSDGSELGTYVFNYPTGSSGIILDAWDHNVARQYPGDYLKGLEVSVQKAIEEAKSYCADFNPFEIIGIGVDTTGSTPLPVDADRMLRWIFLLLAVMSSKGVRFTWLRQDTQPSLETCLRKAAHLL